MDESRPAFGQSRLQRATAPKALSRLPGRGEKMRVLSLLSCPFGNEKLVGREPTFNGRLAGELAHRACFTLRQIDRIQRASLPLKR